MTEATRAERGLRVLLPCGIAVSLGLGFAAVFALSLSIDEAWILLAIQTLAGSSPDVGIPVDIHPIHNTGGFYALVETGITVLAGNAVWAQRLFPFFCLAAVLAALWRWGRKLGGSRAAAALPPAVLLGVPGSLLFGATAHGAVPGFLLVLLAILAWEKKSGRRTGRWLLCGGLAGLAAATRINLAVIFPTLLLSTLIQNGWRRDRLVDGVAVCAIGCGVLVANFWALEALAPSETAWKVFGAGAGLTGSWPGWAILNKGIVANSFLPFPGMVVATAVGLRVDRRRNAPRLLIAFGWLLWAAWLVASPIPHLRYVWPGLAAFAVVLGLGLSSLYAWGEAHGRPWVRVAVLAVALACVLSGIGTTLRHVAYGDTTMIMEEWSRRKGLDPFSAGRRLAHQRAAARYLVRSTRPEETVALVGFPFELRYLTGRPVLSLTELSWLRRWKPRDLPRRLILTPHVGDMIFFPPAGIRWFEENTRLEARFGGYSFYRVTGAWPERPDILIATATAHRFHPPWH